MENLYKVGVIIIDPQPKVEGAVNCICCGYKVAFEEDDIDICPVCNWQYDYDKDENVYSSPNHSSLKDYKENFKNNYNKNANDLKYKIFSK